MEAETEGKIRSISRPDGFAGDRTMDCLGFLLRPLAYSNKVEWWDALYILAIRTTIGVNPALYNTKWQQLMAFTSPEYV